MESDKYTMQELPTFKFPAFFSFSFNSAENNCVGKLTWDDGELKFEGSADESAQILFDVLMRKFAAAFKESVEQRVQMLKPNSAEVNAISLDSRALLSE